MSDLTQLADDAARAVYRNTPTGATIAFDLLPRPVQHEIREVALTAINVALAAGYRKPRTITTVEELEALAEGSVVLDSEDNSAQKHEDGYWHYWGGDSGWGKTIRKFPATVLHEPETNL